jgi:predicted Zn-dependent peptidase
MPIVPSVENVEKNSGKLSEYGKEILKRKSHIGLGGFTEIGKTVNIDTLSKNYILYSTKNPYNDIYTLTIKFNRNMADKRLKPALMLVEVSGTKRRPIGTYMTTMRNYAANYDFDCNNDKVFVTISGKEEYFKEAVDLLIEKIKYPAPKKEQLQIVMNGLIYEKMRKNSDPFFKSLSLMEFIRTGNKSILGTDLTADELNKFTIDELVNIFSQTLNYKADFIFSGNIPSDTLKNILLSHFSDSLIKLKDENLKKSIIKHDEPAVLLSKNSGSLHNRILFISAGDTISTLKEMATAYCFEKYFGQGQLSILTECLRTKNQLSYDYFCKAILEPNVKEPFSFFCYVGTKYQNTFNVLSEVNGVLMNLPVDTLYFELSKQRAINDLLSETEGFRYLAPYIAYYYDLGYKSDPRKELIRLINEVTLDEISEFHQKHISKSVKTYGITGSSKGMIKSRLKLYGKPVNIKNNQFLVM